MSRKQKERMSTVSEKDVIYAVTTADSGNSKDSREKRKKEAKEPLYLKRI
ncbi:MAG: hypothetical protein QXL10_04705 [Candidatus Bathyarchaeia archaeon]